MYGYKYMLIQVHTDAIENIYHLSIHSFIHAPIFFVVYYTNIVILLCTNKDLITVYSNSS